MLVGATVSPTPEPSYSNDPFAPDPTIWPEAPGWLFPMIMVGLVLVTIAVVALLIMWRKSVLVEREIRAERGPTEWIDLSKLDKKGRWEDQDPTPDPNAIEEPDER